MKKTFIYMITLLTFGLTACDEDFNKDVAHPQANDKEEARGVDFQVALGSGLATPIELNNMEPESTIQAITVSTTPTDVAEGTTFTYRLEIAKTEDFAEPVEIAATTADKTVIVTVADLDEAVRTIFGKAPEARQFYIKTWPYVTTGTSSVLGTANIVGPATVTPISIPAEQAYLYVPGNHQNWDPATAPKLYTANMDMVYTGFVYLDGEYKFTSAPNWDSTNYGSGGEGKLSDDGGAGNITAEAGFYYLSADLNQLTYTQTATVWGLIGDATPGGWDASTPMQYDRASNTWTVTTDMTTGTFKFRANDGWDINLGGDVKNLTFGGDNINIEAGNYTLTLKLTNEADGYSCTIKKN